MKRVFVVILLVLAFTHLLSAQSAKGSPSETVLTFYKLLKEKKYVEGFHYSIYRAAIEGLTAAELKDLEPDFARTFSEIPDKIETKGEQITGNSAIVFLKFAGQEEVQQVALIREGKDWLVGDQESFAIVKQQGRAFFFNTRMEVNETETAKTLSRIFGAQIIYAKNFEGRYMDLAEMIRLRAVPEDISDGESNGYKITVSVSADKKNFTLNAVPVVYGKTGRLSFYLDPEGFRADDLKGQPASKTSPIYHPKSD
jgi:hypothetical protein